MKIISKHKDYFDYYQGIFGMDESKVYVRGDVLQYNPPDEYSTLNPPKDETVYDFYICGKQYRILEFRGTFYHTAEELEILDKRLQIIEREKWGRRYSGSGIQFTNWRSKYDDDRYQKEYNATNGINTDLNIKHREPILINQKRGYHDDKDVSVPLLSSFNFHKVLDAKTVYIEVETFLGWLVDNPPLPDTQTNIGKVESHGFDKTYSFRPNMKTNN